MVVPAFYRLYKYVNSHKLICGIKGEGYEVNNYL